MAATVAVDRIGCLFYVQLADAIFVLQEPALNDSVIDDRSTREGVTPEETSSGLAVGRQSEGSPQLTIRDANHLSCGIAWAQ